MHALNNAKIRYVTINIHKVLYYVVHELCPSTRFFYMPWLVNNFDYHAMNNITQSTHIYNYR